MSERERRGVASSHSRKDSKLLRRQRGCSRVFFWNTLFTSSSFAASFIALLEVQETKRATRWWKSRTEKERFQQEGVGRRKEKKGESQMHFALSPPLAFAPRFFEPLLPRGTTRSDVLSAIVRQRKREEWEHKALKRNKQGRRRTYQSRRT